MTENEVYQCLIWVMFTLCVYITGFRYGIKYEQERQGKIHKSLKEDREL
jgi:hypothetical protein